MLSYINQKLPEKLKDKRYRHSFFRGRAEDEIAFELRRFRKKRKLNQKELARLCGMKQSAISRIEQASYSSWTFNTLWRLAEGLDVRIRIVVDDMANVIKAYEDQAISTVPRFSQSGFRGYAVQKTPFADTEKNEYIMEPQYATE